MGHIARVVTHGKGTGERRVSDEYVDPGGESELRRRAAWLLAMLVVVAALLVTFMVVFLSGGRKPPPNGIKPLPTAPPTSASPHHHGHRQHRASRHATSTPTSGSPSSVSTPKRVTHHHVSCPSESPCIGHGDLGNAVAAINAYRTQHGEPAVPGRVTPAAQTCAVTNGDQCTGSWAESQVPHANGKEAVEKVHTFTNLLSPNIKSLQVGWAYDPAAHQYYFAVISNGS